MPATSRYLKTMVTLHCSTSPILELADQQLLRNLSMLKRVFIELIKLLLHQGDIGLPYIQQTTQRLKHGIVIILLEVQKRCTLRTRQQWYAAAEWLAQIS